MSARRRSKRFFLARERLVRSEDGLADAIDRLRALTFTGVSPSMDEVNSAVLCEDSVKEELGQSSLPKSEWTRDYEEYLEWQR